VRFVFFTHFQLCSERLCGFVLEKNLRLNIVTEQLPNVPQNVTKEPKCSDDVKSHRGLGRWRS